MSDARPSKGLKLVELLCLLMPTVNHLSKLFKALASKDLAAAARTAAEIAADEEKKGHGTAAQLLRGSLVSNGTKVHSDQEGGVEHNGQSRIPAHGAFTRQFWRRIGSGSVAE